MKKEVREWEEVATVSEYFESVLSPFAKGVVNPLDSELKKIRSAKKKYVIDLGTGVGNAIPLFSKTFKHVTAIDFSPSMVEKTAQRSRKFKNVTCAVGDMRDLQKYHNKFDVAVSINSIILPTHEEVTQMLKEAYKVLKPKGLFFGVFPSMDAQLYIAMLTFQREYELTGNESKAKQRTNELIDRKKYNFVFGTYEAEGANQKFYYEFELHHRLKAAGFKDIRVDKVFYPWSLCDLEDTQSFRKYPKFWDWFVSCKK